MKKNSRVEQIAAALTAYDAGEKVKAVCLQFNISADTFYRWRKLYGGLAAKELRRVKELELENCRLKKMVVEKMLENEQLKELVAKAHAGKF